MFLDTTQGAATAAPQTGLLPEHQYESVRHMLFGSLTAVRLTIQELHQKQYAEPNDWSKPISTGRPNEVMAILTKRIRVD